MFVRLFRLTTTLALIAGMVWLGRRALIRWVDGPPVAPSGEPWPDVDSPTVRPAAGSGERRAGADMTAAEAPPVPTTAGPATAGAEPGSWVEPGPDGCPASHPVKAKTSSMLYHLPGMLAYARTKPDRCYGSPEAAEADGYTRAKR